MSAQWEECWRFETARFAVVGEAAPDVDAEEADCFVARVRVLLKREGGEESELGSDYLGGCDYGDTAEFFRNNGWQATALRRKREARRILRHVAYLNRYRPTYRAQIARELVNARQHLAAAAECLANERAGYVCCHYFPGMVTEAIREARRTLASLRAA